MQYFLIDFSLSSDVENLKSSVVNVFVFVREPVQYESHFVFVATDLPAHSLMHQ